MTNQAGLDPAILDQLNSAISADYPTQLPRRENKPPFNRNFADVQEVPNCHTELITQDGSTSQKEIVSL